MSPTGNLLRLALPRQSVLWSVAFASYAIVLLAVSVVFVRFVRPGTAAASEAKDNGVEPKTGHWVRWLLFSACGSILLLSVTNQICQDLAVVPFLWILPLSVYLLSFIIAFDHSRWYSRTFVIPALVVVISRITPGLVLK